MKSKCIICKSPSIKHDFTECPRCGCFSIDSQLTHKISVTNDTGHPIIPINKIHLLSSSIRSRTSLDSPYNVREEDIENSKYLIEPSVQDKSDNVLNFIASKSNFAGSIFNIRYAAKWHMDKEITDNDDLFEILGVCFLKNQEELSYILETYLTLEKKYLIENDQLYNGQKQHEFIISPSGWSHYDDINKNLNGHFGFIAMSFDPKFDDLHDQIYKAISDAGWKPLSLKNHAHNENIYNEIVIGIKRAKFIIADFTENNNGAYYEAGYAKGLGIEVIHTVRNDFIDQLHFDTKQIFHVQWKQPQLKSGEFVRNIKTHILATIGSGPYYNG